MGEAREKEEEKERASGRPPPRETSDDDHASLLSQSFSFTPLLSFPFFFAVAISSSS